MSNIKLYKNRNFQITEDNNLDVVKLKGFSRRIAELEWLLLILVILYVVMPGTGIEAEWLVIKSSLFFGFFVLAFRYLNFYRRETRWKLGLEL